MADFGGVFSSISKQNTSTYNATNSYNSSVSQQSEYRNIGNVIIGANDAASELLGEDNQKLYLFLFGAILVVGIVMIYKGK